MEDRSTSDVGPPDDWRQYMRSLPSGSSTFPEFARWIVIAPALAILGMLVAMFGGAVLGLSLGIGPERTGGLIYIVLGLLPGLTGACSIAWIGKRRGRSLGWCRAAFYCFMAPAWGLVGFLAWHLGVGLLRG